MGIGPYSTLIDPERPLGDLLDARGALIRAVLIADGPEARRVLKQFAAEAMRLSGLVLASPDLTAAQEAQLLYLKIDELAGACRALVEDDTSRVQIGILPAGEMVSVTQAFEDCAPREGIEVRLVFTDLGSHDALQFASRVTSALRRLFQV